MPVWTTLVTAAGLGVLGGAVANRAIQWLPRDDGDPERRERRCDVCGAPQRRGVGPAGMAWLLGRARCGYCRARQPLTPVAVEITNGCLWTVLVAVHGWSISTAILMGVITALLTLSLIDLKHYLLPDAITLPGIVVGLVATMLPGWPVSVLDSALSAGLGYFAMMALARIAERHYGEEALGRGDWKMVAMLGALVGSTKLVWILLLANGAGAIVGLLLVAVLGDAGRQRLPLGTFLGAAATLIVMM